MHSSTPGLSRSVELLNSNKTHHRAEVHAEHRPSENDEDYDDHQDGDYVHRAVRTSQPEDTTRTSYYLDSDKEWQYHGSSKNESSDKERFSSISGRVGQRLSSSEKDRNSLEGRSDSELSRNVRLADTKSGVSVAARLEELLSKTNEIIEMERVARKKNKEAFTMFAAEKTAKTRRYSKYFIDGKDHSRIGESGVSSGGGRSTAASGTYEDSLVQQSTSRSSKKSSMSLQIAHEMEKITSSLLGSGLRENSHHSPNQNLEHGPVSPEIAKEFISKKEQKMSLEQEQESSSLISDGSHNMMYVPEFSLQEAKRLVVTPAKRVDMRREAINGNRSSSSRSIGTPPNRMSSLDTPNTSMGVGHGSFGSFYQNTTFENGHESDNGSYNSDDQHDENELGSVDTEDERLELSEMANMQALNELKSRILNGAHWRDQLLIKGLSEVVSEQTDDNPDALSLPVRNKVQELVAKLQSSSQRLGNEDFVYRNEHAEQSESSDDDDEEEEEEEDEVDGAAAVGYTPDGSDVLDMLPMEREKPKSSQRCEPSSINTFAMRPPISSRPKPFVELPNSSSEFTPISSPSFVVPTSLPPAQPIIDTRYLIPKDAYFHELPHRSRVPSYPSPQDQNYGTTSFTSHQHSSHSFAPQPLSSPLNPPESAQTLLVTSRPIFYQSHHVIPPPNREKLLSNRKFTPSHEPPASQPSYFTERPLPDASVSHFVNIDQVQMERDANNDSGFSTRLSGGSQNGHSPSLSGRIDRDAAMVAQHVRMDEYPRKNGTIDERSGVNVTTHFEPYFLANIGASSLV